MIAPSPSSNDAERGAWRSIAGEWRQLFGSFSREGVSVEHHRFRTERELDWGRSFHPDSLEICLNFQGAGRLQAEGQPEATVIGVRSAAFYHVPEAPSARALVASRAPGEEHHFVTIEMSRTYLGRQLGEAADALQGSVGLFLAGSGHRMPFALATPMSVAVQNTARALVDPPLASDATSARRFWYGAKVMELIALLLFNPDTPAGAAPVEELFCDRQKRITVERIEKARALLERDLENPPSLEMLAAAVGCGAFHLSRTFSQHVGQTIPQYLRRVRLERAARLLREGRGNVSEVAVAVGYQSLSHFSKAFWEQFGCCPGLYGNPRLAEVTRATRRRPGGRPVS